MRVRACSSGKFNKHLCCTLNREFIFSVDYDSYYFQNSTFNNALPTTIPQIIHLEIPHSVGNFPATPCTLFFV